MAGVMRNEAREVMGPVGQGLVWIPFCLPLHLWMSILRVFSYFLAIGNSVAMNISVGGLMCTHFHFLGVYAQRQNC